MRDRLEGLSTLLIGALEGPIAVRVSQEMVLEMLLLLECLIAAFERAGKLPLVTLEMPVKLALRNELAIEAYRTLEL